MTEFVTIAKDIAPILASAAALMAVFFGPLIQVKIANKQQRATVLSNNRVRWIEDFRKEVAEFAAQTYLFEIQKSYREKEKFARNEDMVKHYDKEIDASFARTHTMYNSVRMKIDLNNKLQRPIVKLMDEICEINIADVNFDIDKFEEIMRPKVDELLLVTREMLKEEWRKVERLG